MGLLGALYLCGAVRAQDSAASAPAPQPGQEVQMAAETLGVGGYMRPGELTGFRLVLTDSFDRPREVAVRLRLTDADGDTTIYQRAITLNPQRAVGVWIYARLPWYLRPSTVISFTANVATPSADGSLTIGRQVGVLRVSPGSAQATVIEQEAALVGVVGRRPMGLEHFTQSIGGAIVSVAGHEALRVVNDLAVAGFPDQWEGWAGFETIVWSQADPNELEGDARASALIEWVNRGGQLVVIVPSVASPWSSPRNPLASILPRAAIERVVDVDLNAYRALLTLDKAGATSRLPERSTIHRFVIPQDAELSEAIPLISGPDGCVVVRRLVGTGMVTLVGIDLSAAAVAVQVRSDSFWNRILGRRTDQLNTAEADAARWRVGGVGLNTAGALVDAQIAEQIATGREASWGILLSLVVFAVYWCLAGPAGFAILKSRGLERHSWLGFVVMAGLFTAVAWAGAGAMRPKVAQSWHYTLLDHVYGQPVQRARSFASILLPDYGDQTVTLGESGVDAQWRQALTPWADPQGDVGLRFPDARDYIADVRNLTSLTVPARSTIKQFEAEWLGGPRWSMPAPLSPEQRPALGPNGALTGAIVHSLPHALTEVQVILVRGQIGEAEDIAETRKRTSSRTRFEAWAWARPEPWEPGDPLDLAGYNERSTATDIRRLLRDLVPTVSLTGSVPGIGGPRVEDRGRELSAALFGQLEPPEYAERRTIGTSTRATMRRVLTHTWDLGEWFTQPCLIVIGMVNDEPSPVPLAVDGEALDGKQLPSTGRTVVRWIYPLPASPVRFEGGAALGTS